MKRSVSDFVGPLIPPQREWLDEHLQEGEQVLWAARPKAVFRLRAMLPGMLICLLLLTFGLMADVLIVRAIWEKAAAWSNNVGWVEWLNRLVSCLFMLVGLGLALLATFLGFIIGCVIVRSKSDLRRTLYVLTDRRALCLAPDFGRGCLCDEYSLDDDMVRLRRSSRAGDELIFRVDADGTEKGWRGLRDAAEAEARIEEALRRRRGR